MPRKELQAFPAGISARMLLQVHSNMQRVRLSQRTLEVTVHQPILQELVTTPKACIYVHGASVQGAKKTLIMPHHILIRPPLLFSQATGRLGRLTLPPICWWPGTHVKEHNRNISQRALLHGLHSSHVCKCSIAVAGTSLAALL